MTRSTWSGGVTWSGTAKWMPDGLTASGPIVPDVAIGGTLRTGLQNAQWRLGPNGFLDELSPGSCSLSFAGAVTAAIGDVIIISIPSGVLWVGRVDASTTTTDAAGHQWSTVNGTDPLGALGAAELVAEDSNGADLEESAEIWAAVAGITLDVVDLSSGLPNIVPATTITASVLATINSLARQSNAMLALQRDGTVAAVIRESVTPADQVDISDRYREWTERTDLAVDVNRWAEEGDNAFASDDADIALYGQRTYAVDFTAWTPPTTTQFVDWYTYGGSQRPVATAILPMTGWADDDLMLLDPFGWVTRDLADWQIMSVSHSVSVSPPAWDVTLTLDNLLDLL